MKQRGTKILGWRRIASAIWKGPGDPQIQGIIEVDARPVLAIVEQARAHGVHLTITGVAGKAVAHALAAVPDLNVRLRFGRFVTHPTVDIFFITAVASGRDLSGVKVVATDRKSVAEIANELGRRSATLKGGTDRGFARSKRTMERIPFFFLRPILRVLSWLIGGLGVPIRALGLEASPFGSAMITSVGMFGLQVGFSPLAWLYRVPILVLVGEVTRKPVATETGDVVVRPILPITASIDHRFADGFQIAQLVRYLREYLAAPERFEPAWLRAPLVPSELPAH